MATQVQSNSARADGLLWAVFGVLIAAVYWPVIAEEAHRWFTDEMYAHGVFIFPVAAALVWLRRGEIARAPLAPTAWGLLPLSLGLLVQVASYLLRVKYLGLWSLILVLAGAILTLHGPGLWKIVRFPVLYLVFAGAIPHFLVQPAMLAIQQATAVGSAAIAHLIGFAVIRSGNSLSVPGAQLDVAEACSGFRKLISMVAIGALYGYLFPIGNLRRIVLCACALPIALAANTARVVGLVAITCSGGIEAMHRAHDAADIFVLILSFGLFVVIGRGLGCVKPRFGL